MTYATFAFYNVVGAVAWVGLCLGAGYAFGNVPVVKENFSLVTLGIVFVSLLPARSSSSDRERGDVAGTVSRCADTRPAQSRRQRLPRIVFQVLDVLEAGRNADQAVGDAQSASAGQPAPTHGSSSPDGR